MILRNSFFCATGPGINICICVLLDKGFIEKEMKWVGSFSDIGPVPCQLNGIDISFSGGLCFPGCLILLCSFPYFC